MIVFAPVSAGYDFINHTILSLEDSAAKPPFKYPFCINKGGFYDYQGDLASIAIFNCW
jgi:hypothetical protein